jgi:hypothetical protein
MGGHVNILSVLVAAIAAWVFGAIYYTALGKIWLGCQGKTPESHRADLAAKSKLAFAMPFILSFVGALIMGVVAWSPAPSAGSASC